MSNLREMLDELAVIPEALEDAALAEDADLFVRLQMRDLALRSMIREAELEPYRNAVENLEGELRELDEEREKALEAPLPKVPEHLRGSVTPAMRHRQVLESIAARSAAASRDLKEARARLETAEGVGGRHHAMTTT